MVSNIEYSKVDAGKKSVNLWYIWNKICIKLIPKSSKDRKVLRRNLRVLFGLILLFSFIIILLIKLINNNLNSKNISWLNVNKYKKDPVLSKKNTDEEFISPIVMNDTLRLRNYNNNKKLFDWQIKRPSGIQNRKVHLLLLYFYSFNSYEYETKIWQEFYAPKENASEEIRNQKNTLIEVAKYFSNKDILHIGIPRDHMNDFQYFLDIIPDESLPLAMIVCPQEGWKKYRLDHTVINEKNSYSRENHAQGGRSGQPYIKSDGITQTRLKTTRNIENKENPKNSIEEKYVADREILKSEETQFKSRRKEKGNNIKIFQNEEESVTTEIDEDINTKNRYRNASKNKSKKRSWRVRTYSSSSSIDYSNNVISVADLIDFENDFFDNKLEPWRRSELPINGDKYSTTAFTNLPKGTRGMISTGILQPIVGSQFQTSVLETPTDTLLLFNAPWCGICRNYLKRFTEFALKFRGIYSIDFLVIDITRNDLPHDGVSIERIPSVRFFKSGKKSQKPIYFNHARKDVANYGTTFLQAHSTCNFDIEKGTQECYIGQETSGEL